MDAERLGKLLAGEVVPETDEERGALVLVALNYHTLRLEEDRARYELVKTIGNELRLGRERTKGQAA